MSTQPGSRPGPSIDLRGAVDLSSLGGRPKTGSAPSAGSVGEVSGLVIDVTDADFVESVIQRSDTVPVVIDFWATWCEPCKQLSPVLTSLAAEYAGQFLLAKVDVDANPQLSQAFRVQSIPSVFAVLRGQPVPLFQGAQPEVQVRQVLDQLLKVAAENGVTGRLDVVGPADTEAVQEVEDELPPHHQAAYDAIEAGDLDAAVAAYTAALSEDPDDEMARLGLAQTLLMKRTAGVDPVAARRAAADAPLDVEAQTLVADIDVLGGHVQDAFDRLIDTVRVTSGEDRNRARSHLIDLFEVVGVNDPRVSAARPKLASALF